MRPHEKTTTTVVFFLGGCTYTEIAALRWMGRQNKGTKTAFDGYNLTNIIIIIFQGRRFLVATTGIVSGASIIEGIAGIGKATGGLKEARI